METALFYFVWPWIGLGAAIVILILMFATDFLRVETDKSRWKDPFWLAWVGTVGYMLHNVEEYAIDLTGASNAFPNSIEQIIGTEPAGYFFLVVNFSLVWIAAPLTAYLSRKYKWRLFALAMPAFMLINSLTHNISFLAIGKYNPGLLTAGILFLPITLWTVYVCFGKGKMKYSGMWVLFAIALIYHIIMFGAMIGIYGRLGGDVTISIILGLDAVLMFYLWYKAQTWRGGRLAEI